MAELTLDCVKVVSVVFWPVRPMSLCKVVTSVPGEVPTGLTVSIAGLLVTVFTELLIITRKVAPLSPETVAGVM